MTHTNVASPIPAGAAGVTRALGLGLVLWGVMFSWSTAFHTWAVANRPLFEALRAVALAGTATAVGTAYLRGLKGRILGRAVAASALWTLTCLSLDVVISMLQPSRVSVGEYFANSGLSYLMIPVIVLGLTYQRLRVQRQ